MKSKISILLAVVALIASTLACALGEPTLSNVHTTKDEAGTQPTSVYGVNDTVYVISDLSNTVKGNEVMTKLYAVQVEGVEPNYLVAESTKTLDEDIMTGTWTVTIDPPWVVGSYKAEVYFNGKLINTVQFTVQ
jgi:hypothetical protein